MATCEAEGTTLATVKDGWDEAFIETYMYINSIRNAWIGLQDLVSTKRYRLSGTHNSETSLKSNTSI